MPEMPAPTIRTSTCSGSAGSVVMGTIDDDRSGDIIRRHASHPHRRHRRRGRPRPRRRGERARCHHLALPPRQRPRSVPRRAAHHAHLGHGRLAEGVHAPAREAPAGRLLLRLPDGLRPAARRSPRSASTPRSARSRATRPRATRARAGSTRRCTARSRCARSLAGTLERPSAGDGYGDVRDAWRDYLQPRQPRPRRHPHRPLAGHVRAAPADRARRSTRSAAARKRLVSAILLGGNVLVKRGSDTGGDFKHVRAVPLGGRSSAA